MSAREFNQSVAKAQRMADGAPVMVTKHGVPAYVLLSVAAYERLLPGERENEGPRTFLEMMAPPEGVVFDDDDEFDRVLGDIRKNSPDRRPFEFD